MVLLSKCYMIPLGVSQLHDLEIPGRWHHFHIQLRLLFFLPYFDYILISMGSNTGKSDVTSFQHMCYAIIVYLNCTDNYDVVKMKVKSVTDHP